MQARLVQPRQVGPGDGALSRGPGACRDKPGKPFRCLDPQYRRELVRVYLTNVEGICRRFCDDRRTKVVWARDEASKFKEFWAGLTADQQRKLMTERGETVLKVGMAGNLADQRRPERMLTVAVECQPALILPSCGVPGP